MIWQVFKGRHFHLLFFFFLNCDKLGSSTSQGLRTFTENQAEQHAVSHTLLEFGQ